MRRRVITQSPDASGSELPRQAGARSRLTSGCRLVRPPWVRPVQGPLGTRRLAGRHPETELAGADFPCERLASLRFGAGRVRPRPLAHPDGEGALAMDRPADHRAVVGGFDELCERRDVCARSAARALRRRRGRPGRQAGDHEQALPLIAASPRPYWSVAAPRLRPVRRRTSRDAASPREEPMSRAAATPCCTREMIEAVQRDEDSRQYDLNRRIRARPFVSFGRGAQRELP